MKDEYDKIILSSKKFARFVGKFWSENFGQKYTETLDEAFLLECKKEGWAIAKGGRLLTIGSIINPKQCDIKIRYQ